ELHTSQGVGRLRTCPVDRHLPPTPALALVPAPAPQPAASAPEPAPAPPPPSAPAPAPAAASDVPESLFAVELNKSMIQAIKSAAKEELRRVMMQERVAVSATQKQRGAVINKALKKARISMIGQVKYKSFKDKKGVREDLVTCMSNVWRLFRDYAANIIQTALGLCLPISSQPGEEVAHKATVVPELLKDLNFVHKLELDDDGIEQCRLLEADYFIEMIIHVVWQKGLHEYIDLVKLNSAMALGRAAVHNALKAHHTGRFDSVDASAKQFYDIYNSILELIDRIRADPALRARYKMLQQLIVTRGSRVH
ncbi:hypothetical protein DFJ58DRAFT_796389, partial [Suillus subalutaceus]|uniref:uncharacterized protein n=1 Tax=Suillus subalutaceus TaxID=48586 RepID=UPI001B879B46